MFVFCLTWLTYSSNINKNMFAVGHKQYSKVTKFANITCFSYLTF